MSDWKSRWRAIVPFRRRDPDGSLGLTDASLPEPSAAPEGEATLPEPDAPLAEAPAPPPPAEPPVVVEEPVTAAPEGEAAAPAASSPPVAREAELEEEIRSLREERRRLVHELAGERSERLRLEEEVRALSDQDPLTGLASARRFHDRLAVAIIHARRVRQKLAIVQMGLDKLEAVTDRLGAGPGDDLLRSVALALESSLRQGDTIARFGDGDAFTILLPGLKRDEDITVMADKLRLALRSPFSIGGHDVQVSASFGIALFPDDGQDNESLLQAAALTMQGVRERGGDGWDVHAPRSRAIAAEQQAREGALRRALAKGDLELYWQPVVESETGTIVGMESLLRWRAGEGLVNAADFVSLADVSGLAVPLGQWTLRAACRQAKKWHDAGHDKLVVSVNISVRQLAHAALVKLVRRVLEETGLPAACLELEVSEGELPRGPELAIERLAELRRLGLRIALDDFGVGESRIAHLYRYPIDTLKIDGSIVRDAVTNRDHEAVISAAVALARSRRLRVVAEGVESEAQRVLLVRWQCDCMQGNLSGPPVTAAEAEGLLIRQRRTGQEATLPANPPSTPPPSAPAVRRLL
jgi:diguanylate cyclase (GGDEF)-like protein